MRLLSVLVVSSVLFACASSQEQKESAPQAVDQSLVNLSNVHLIKSSLDSQYQQWRGTRYKLGGTTRQGVDCSGFVYLTYHSVFDLNLPRTTEQQAKLGTSVRRGDLQLGDLVFFKTGLFLRHVGIYIGEKKFLHASTSKGVTISRLDNSYWRSAYWKAKRL